MKKIPLSSAIAILVVCLLTGGMAQVSEQTLTGIVTCQSCVVKGARRVDLACARTCLDKNTGTAVAKSTDVTKNASGDIAKGSLTDLTSASGNASKSSGADSTKSASANPPKSTSTDLVIIADGNYNTVPVDNPDKVKSHLAHHVAVTGYWLRGVFHVISVRVL